MLYLVSLPLYATLQFMAHANIRLFLTDTFAYINLDFKVFRDKNVFSRNLI